MSNVTVLKKKACPEVVEFLQKALARAEAGNTTGVLLIEQDPDGTANYSLAGIEDRFKVSGYLFCALNRLQYDDPK